MRNINFALLLFLGSVYGAEECTPCQFSSRFDQPEILVFISFSVPESIWLSLSKEMEKYKAVFILRGLPDNSFVEFSKRVSHLKQIGLQADIQIHPTLFDQYKIKAVPTFVITSLQTAEGYDTVSGNISLDCALSVMQKKGQVLLSEKKYLEAISNGY